MARRPDTLRLEVDVDEADYVRSMARAEQATAGLERSVESLDGDLAGFDESAGHAADSVGAPGGAGLAGRMGGLGAAVGGLGLAGAAGGLLSLAGDAAATALEIGRLSDQTGISVDTLDRWRQIAADAGSELDELTEAQKTINEAVQEAARGGEAEIDRLDRLGVAWADLVDASPAEQLYAVSDALVAGARDADAMAAAHALLGGDLRAIAETTDGLTRSLRDAADATSATITDADVAQAEDYQEQMGDLAEIATEVGLTALPAVAAGLDAIAATVDGIDAATAAVVGFGGEVLAYYGIVEAEAETTQTNLERLAAEVGEDAAASIRDSTDSAIRRAQLQIDAMHYAGTQSQANFEAATAASAAVTAQAWEAAYGAAAGAAEESARRQIGAAALTAQAWEDAYRAVSPDRGRQLGQTSRYDSIAALRAGLARRPGGGPGPAPAAHRRIEVEPTDEDQQAVRLLDSIDDWQQLTLAEAAAAAEAQRDALAQAADADGRRTLAEHRLIADAQRQIDLLERIAATAEASAAAGVSAAGPGPDTAAAAAGRGHDPFGGRFRGRTAAELERMQQLAIKNLERGIGSRHPPPRIDQRITVELDGAALDARITSTVVDAARTGTIDAA